jgi:hypothetical protein
MSTNQKWIFDSHRCRLQMSSLVELSILGTSLTGVIPQEVCTRQIMIPFGGVFILF